jgi:hypothetical protein
MEKLPINKKNFIIICYIIFFLNFLPMVEKVTEEIPTIVEENIEEEREQ